MCNSILLTVSMALLPFFSFWSGRVQHIPPQELENPRVPWPLSVYNDAFHDEDSVPLTEESLIHAATHLTGLQDFGDESHFPFRDGLAELLADATRSDVNVSAYGKVHLREMIIRALSIRLQVANVIKQHPEILDEEIDRPLWIIGTPRSGATYLHRLLDQHSGFRAPKLFEVLEPVITDQFLLTKATGGNADPRIARCKEHTALVKSLRPKLNVLHHEDALDAVDEAMAVMPTFRSSQFGMTIPVRTYFQWYLYQSKTEEFDYLRMVLQILQWQDKRQGKPQRRWVLKGQAHSIHLPFLWRVFPTVEIVHLHRDPVAAMPAYLTYLAYSQGIFSRNLDLKDLGAWFTIEYDSFLHKAQSIREYHHNTKVTDVYFEDLVKDNLNVVKEVLDFSEEELGAQDEENIKTYISTHERYRDGHLEYDLTPFGLQEEVLRKKFDFYNEYFHIPREFVKESGKVEGHDEL